MRTRPWAKDHRLILASASPRRRMLLAQVGVPYDVMESRVEEARERLDATPEGHVMEAAARKALDVALRAGHGIVLGADTIVHLDGEILGKPHTAREARAMLQYLSGRTHVVYTGLALARAQDERLKSVDGGPARDAMALVDYEATEVTMRELSRREISAYVDTGEPMDKAGAYAIQGRGAVLVAGIKGCYFNVVGLPLAKLATLLGQLGLNVL